MSFTIEELFVHDQIGPLSQCQRSIFSGSGSCRHFNGAAGKLGLEGDLNCLIPLRDAAQKLCGA